MVFLKSYIQLSTILKLITFWVLHLDLSYAWPMYYSFVGFTFLPSKAKG